MLLLAAIAGLAVTATPAAAATGTWAIVASPNNSLSQNNYMYGVSCTSASFCVTAGSTGFTTPQTFGEEWNGSVWSLLSTPNTSTNKANSLNAVSCTSQTFCVAVGVANSSAQQTLVEQWNGSSWAIVSSADTASNTNNVLTGVSCTSPTFCVAVGYDGTGTGQQTLTEQWNGSAWAIVSSPNATSTAANQLLAVSCATAALCQAVGKYVSASYDQALVEQWNGSAWSLVTAPNATTTGNNDLYGVSCASALFCSAVGHYVGAKDQTLIEQWSGAGWAIVPSPNSSAAVNNDLTSVSCPSAAFCMASGDNHPSAYDQTLVEQWDGSSWTLATTPSTSATDSDDLTATSCPTTAFCVTTGTYSPSVYRLSLVEQWTPPTAGASSSSAGQSITVTTSGGGLAISAPPALALGSLVPGTASLGHAVGSMSWTDTLNDGMPSSVSVQATDLCAGACGAGSVIPFTDLTFNNGQTVTAADQGSCSGSNDVGAPPTPTAAASTPFSGADPSPGTTLSAALTLANASTTTEGCWALAGSTLDLSVPAALAPSQTLNGTLQYTVTG